MYKSMFDLNRDGKIDSFEKGYALSIIFADEDFEDLSNREAVKSLNKKLEALKEAVSESEDKLSELKDMLSELENSDFNLESKKSDFETELSEHEEELSGLEDELSDLEFKDLSATISSICDRLEARKTLAEEQIHATFLP